MQFIPEADALPPLRREHRSMSFPEVLKQPSTFVAAALVVACLLALIAAIGGVLLINSATGAALALPTAAPPIADAVVVDASASNLSL